MTYRADCLDCDWKTERRDEDDAAQDAVDHSLLHDHTVGAPARTDE